MVKIWLSIKLSVFPQASPECFIRLSLSTKEHSSIDSVMQSYISIAPLKNLNAVILMLLVSCMLAAAPSDLCPAARNYLSVTPVTPLIARITQVWSLNKLNDYCEKLTFYRSCCERVSVRAAVFFDLFSVKSAQMICWKNLLNPGFCACAKFKISRVHARNYVAQNKFLDARQKFLARNDPQLV